LVDAAEHVVRDDALGDVEGVLLQVSSGVGVGEEAGGDDLLGVVGSCWDVCDEAGGERGAGRGETGEGGAVVEHVTADVGNVCGVRRRAAQVE